MYAWMVIGKPAVIQKAISKNEEESSDEESSEDEKSSSQNPLKRKITENGTSGSSPVGFRRRINKNECLLTSC